MAQISHQWLVDSLHEARLMRRKKIPYNKVKDILDQLKPLMRKELDPDVKADLVRAGMSLNRVLLK